jgi:hypothetical protein
MYFTNNTIFLRISSFLLRRHHHTHLLPPSNHFILLPPSIEVINEYKSWQSIDKKVINFEGKIIILRILFDLLL